MNKNINNNTEKKENPNIKTEAYKINLEVDSERILYEKLLKKSNNKSGLVKDALSMYLTLIEKGAYVSPFIKNDVSDWTTILKNLTLDNDLGRPAEQVKEEVIQETMKVQQPVQQPVHSASRNNEKVELNIKEAYEYDEEDDEQYENEDNDI